jgi:hypothetical protein
MTDRQSSLVPESVKGLLHIEGNDEEADLSDIKIPGKTCAASTLHFLQH